MDFNPLFPKNRFLLPENADMAAVRERVGARLDNWSRFARTDNAEALLRHIHNSEIDREIAIRVAFGRGLVLAEYGFADDGPAIDCDLRDPRYLWLVSWQSVFFTEIRDGIFACGLFPSEIMLEFLGKVEKADLRPHLIAFKLARGEDVALPSPKYRKGSETVCFCEN